MEGVIGIDLGTTNSVVATVRNNRVEEPLAQAVLARLGADQYVQLTTCIGYYAMLAMTVNGAELPPNPDHEALNAT